MSISKGTGMNGTRLTACALAAAAVTGALTGCGSDASKVSKNLSTAADQFEVQRHIVGINGITDKILFEVDGRCSIDRQPGALIVVCKHGPKDYRKHFIGLSDNVTYIATQDKGLPADVYHTRIILKPQNLVPNFDLVTGSRP